MSDRLEPWLAALVRQERARSGPSSARKRRVLERVRRSVEAPPASAPESSTTGATGGPSRTRLARASTVALALAVVVAGALLASRSSWTARRSEGVAAAPAARSGAAAAPAPTPDPPVLAASPHVDVTPPSVDLAKDGARPVALAGPGPSATQRLREERELLDRARARLLEGEPVAALQTIDIHHRRFPRGALSEERDALRIEALGSAGKTGDACRAARAFHAAYPGSLLARAVDDTCGGPR